MSKFSDRDGYIWLDGEYIPWRDAKVHLLTHTLHYGLGVFEGVRAYNGDKGTAIFRLQDHTERFFRSAKIVNLEVPFEKETLNQVQIDIIRKNELKSAYLRPMCFLGSEGMGLHAQNLKSHVMIATWEWGAYLGAENLQKGIKVKVSSYARHHVNAAMCKAKANGNYINSIMALQEAERAGCDEALMLDSAGFVAEGSGENFFMVRNGTLYTPDLTSVLEGITRDTIIQFASDLNISLVEKRITRDEVYIADEAFFTGTAAEITPIREVDGRVIGDGTPGRLTRHFQKLYFDTVQGREDKYSEWLTIVE